MATKKKPSAAATALLATVAPPTGSRLKGTGTSRGGKRFIVIYGAPKVRKTTTVSFLHGRRVKWLVSDSNCIPTLEALGRMPHPDDIHEVGTLYDAKMFLQSILDLVTAEGVEALGFDFLALDSVTQYFNWHKEEVAKVTTQRFMGDNDKNNGWNLFNAEFGTFLDLLAQVAKYVTVVAIAHSVEPTTDDKRRASQQKKGAFGGLNLSPQMSAKLGQLGNWILYQTISTSYVDASEPGALESDMFISAEQLPNGTIKHTEVVIHTTPEDIFIASVNSRMVDGKPVLEAEEPGNLEYILVKEGLLEARS